MSIAMGSAFRVTPATDMPKGYWYYQYYGSQTGDASGGTVYDVNSFADDLSGGDEVWFDGASFWVSVPGAGQYPGLSVNSNEWSAFDAGIASAATIILAQSTVDLNTLTGVNGWSYYPDRRLYLGYPLVTTASFNLVFPVNTNASAYRASLRFLIRRRLV